MKKYLITLSESNFLIITLFVNLVLASMSLRYEYHHNIIIPLVIFFFIAFNLLCGIRIFNKE